MQALVEQATPRLIAIVRRDGASIEDAEDAAQEAIFNSLRRLAELKFDGVPGKDPFFNYLVRAARNYIFDKHRVDEQRGRLPSQIQSLDERQAVVPAGGGLDEPDTDDDANAHQAEIEEPVVAAQDGRVQFIKDFLDALSPEDQLMLQLDAEDVLTSGEIGLEVGLRGDTVRQRVRRLHQRFRAYVADKELRNA